MTGNKKRQTPFCKTALRSCKCVGRRRRRRLAVVVIIIAHVLVMAASSLSASNASKYTWKDADDGDDDGADGDDVHGDEEVSKHAWAWPVLELLSGPVKPMIMMMVLTNRV